MLTERLPGGIRRLLPAVFGRLDLRRDLIAALFLLRNSRSSATNFVK